MQERTKQGGSVLVFGIIGVVLAAAVIGLVFLVNKRADDGLTGPLFDIPQATDESNPADERKPADESQPAGSDDSDRADDSDQPAAGTTDRGTNQPASPAPADDKSTPADKPLPQTGPADSALAGLMLAALTAALLAYRRSRNPANEL